MATQNIRWRSRLLLPFFLLLLTTVYVASALQITPQFSEGLVGPRFLPLLAALCMYGALLRIIWSELTAEETSSKGTFWQPVAIVLATAAYIAAFKLLGYSLATLLYVLALFHIFHFQQRHVLKRLLYAIAITVVFYGLFALVFGVRLPTLLDLI